MNRIRGWRLGAAAVALVATLLAAPTAAAPSQDEGAVVEEQAEAGEPEPPAAEEEAPAPVEPEAVDLAAPRYHRPDEAAELMSSWLGSGMAEELDLGVSAGGRRLIGIQFGGSGATPLDQRSTILLLGGLDGVSTAGAEAVLAVTHSLLEGAVNLPPDVTFVAVPWANPDGLTRWLESGLGGGGNDRPVDDDHDGVADEDGPDDMDGDEAVVELLIEDPDGPWARGPDGRFLRPARADDGERFLRFREGVDGDGDGLFNEDGLGGVVLDHNFPVGWRGPWSGWASGPRPLSEPASAALARLARERRTVAALVFQGNHGRLATPGGLRDGSGASSLPFPEDEAAYLHLTRVFERTTSRAQPELLRIHEARGREHPGAAVDWFYAALGALAMEIGVWGPEIQMTSTGALDARFVREGRYPLTELTELTANGASGDAATRADRAWARWLDDTRGGIGFVDWQPAELGEGRRGWIGGWERNTCINPPAEALSSALEGLESFVLTLAGDLPRLRIELYETVREGRIGFLRARIHNGGRLATGVGPAGATAGIRVRLVLPEGASLVAGEAEIEIPHLPGAGRSSELEWMLVAPEGSTLRLEVESSWSATVVKEARL